MAMETAVTMALAMGRTLVIPPEQQLYLLQKTDKGQKNRFTFKDFFHFDSVELEHKALEVITLEEFLKREAITGNMRDKKTGEVSYPPDNRTNWNGQANYESHKNGIFPWLRTVTKTIDWNWEKCIAGFPKEPGEAGAESLKSIFEEAKSKISGEWRQRVNQYSGNPTPVDASAADRILELLGSREKLCLYDTSYQEAKFVHAMGDNDSGARMLAHFYSFIFYEDWHHDLWTKRFVRDHLRYIDQLQCHAAKVVNFLRMKAQTFGDPNGEFYTMHIRRGTELQISENDPFFGCLLASISVSQIMEHLILSFYVFRRFSVQRYTNFGGANFRKCPRRDTRRRYALHCDRRKSA